MITCSQCAFWDVPLGKREATVAAGCNSPKFVMSYGAWKFADDQVQLEGDEGWGMTVGRSFGCIHAERRKES